MSVTSEPIVSMNSPHVKHRARAGSEGASPDSVSVSSVESEDEDDDDDDVVSASFRFLQGVFRSQRDLFAQSYDLRFELTAKDDHGLTTTQTHTNENPPWPNYPAARCRKQSETN